MNIWQRIVVLVGAIRIALLFTAYPHMEEVEKPYHWLDRSDPPVRYKMVYKINYGTTLLESGATAIVTCGLVLLLGAVKRRPSS